MPNLRANKAKAKKLLKLFGPSGLHWTTRTWARSTTRTRHRAGSMDAVQAKSYHAKSWCLIGACEKLGIDSTFLHTELPLPFGTVFAFNDADGWRPIKNFLTKIAKYGTFYPQRAKQG